jgi:hypothetical protein
LSKAPSVERVKALNYIGKMMKNKRLEGEGGSSAGDVHAKLMK